MKLFKGNFGIILIIVGIIGFVYFNNFYHSNENETVSQNQEYVGIKENDLIQVEIKGEVNIPGIYSIEADYRVVDLISLAGGLTINADTSTINRAQKLTDEMVLIIPKKSNESTPDQVSPKYIDVEIRGAINFPGVYQMNENSIVNDLVLKAGGLTKEANLYEINLAKKLENGEQITISKIIKDIETEIFVEIKGEVNEPGVYMLSEGSIVYDLIEVAGGLTNEADTSKLSQVDLLLNHQVIEIPSMTLLEEKTIAVDIKGEVNNPNVYYFSEELRVIDVINVAGGFTKNADYNQINLSKTISDEELIIIQKKDDSNGQIVVDLKGEVKYPGVYYLNEGSRIEDLIDLAGGFKPDANKDAINLSSLLVDEQMVVVPKQIDENEYIYVQISGEVMRPGVYALLPDTRLIMLINIAGGFTNMADTDQINLTRILIDEENIYIPNIEEETNKIYVSITGEIKYSGTYYIDSHLSVLELIEIAGGLTLDADVEAIDYNQELVLGSVINIPSLENQNQLPDEIDDLVNINTANLETLQTLTGIGVILAERIIEYRINHNGFNSIDEIMNVSGIKDSIYDKIKDDITI